jgi:hypothetical protein
MLKLSMQQTNRWEARKVLEVAVLPPIEILAPGYDKIYIISFSPPLNTKQHMVTIINILAYTCVDFISMMACSLGGCAK